STPPSAPAQRLYMTRMLQLRRGEVKIPGAPARLAFGEWRDPTGVGNQVQLGGRRGVAHGERRPGARPAQVDEGYFGARRAEIRPRGEAAREVVGSHRDVQDGSGDPDRLPGVGRWIGGDGRIRLAAGQDVGPIDDRS